MRWRTANRRAERVRRYDALLQHALDMTLCMVTYDAMDRLFERVFGARRG